MSLGTGNTAASTSPDATRQESLQSPVGTPIPSPPPASEDRGGTADVGTNQQNSGAVPGATTDQSGRVVQQENELTAGGSPRQGAMGRNMAECEAAWDKETHMSKQSWRDTCQRTLVSPHL